MSCEHADVECLNAFELVRKYRCGGCGAVMMCGCDQERGERFLPHQLRDGTELKTRRRVPVTHGFQKGICDECRGLPAPSTPVAEIHGRTSKIKRYYWRELQFRELELLGSIDNDDPAERERAATQALKEIKELHQQKPKYVFDEVSQQRVLEENAVERVDLHAVYSQRQDGERTRVQHGLEAVGVEEFVRRHFEEIGYACLELESRPFHALFGVLLWPVIQDPADPLNRTAGFQQRAGARGDADARGMIWTLLPEDFGTEGYWKRRRRAVEAELENIAGVGTLWAFDHRVEASEHLRQYLWAHEKGDVQRARRIVEILPADHLERVLRYLAMDYWRHYLGWPDLLLYKHGEYFLAEVKGSGDKLSEDQKAWIAGNTKLLQMPFKLVKVHRARETRER